MISIQISLRPRTAAVNSRVYRIIWTFPISGLFQTVLMISGSWVPSSRKTRPFKTKIMTAQVLLDTMLSLATSGFICLYPKEWAIPALTTASIPLTPSSSAAIKIANGVRISISICNVTFSIPSLRSRRTIPYLMSVSTRPSTTPPSEMEIKLRLAVLKEKAPVTIAATAN